MNGIWSVVKIDDCMLKIRDKVGFNMNSLCLGVAFKLNNSLVRNSGLMQ